MIGPMNAVAAADLMLSPRLRSGSCTRVQRGAKPQQPCGKRVQTGARRNVRESACLRPLGSNSGAACSRNPFCGCYPPEPREPAA